jgi:hypothetical protein
MQKPSIPLTGSPHLPLRFSRAKPLAVNLGITTRTLSRWAAQGLIARYRVNPRVVMYDIAEVTAFITSSRV